MDPRKGKLMKGHTCRRPQTAIANSNNIRRSSKFCQDSVAGQHSIEYPTERRTPSLVVTSGWSLSPSPVRKPKRRMLDATVLADHTGMEWTPQLGWSRGSSRQSLARSKAYRSRDTTSTQSLAHEFTQDFPPTPSRMIDDEDSIKDSPLNILMTAENSVIERSASPVLQYLKTVRVINLEGFAPLIILSRFQAESPKPPAVQIKHISQPPSAKN